MLGVEEHPEVVRSEELDRVGHHGHRLVQGGAQCVDHVYLRRLGHDADRFGLGIDQVPQGLVLLRLHPGPPGRSEGHQLGSPERELGGSPGEELFVLGVGPRPPALDEGHPEVVELFGHAELVVHGEGEPLLLGAVPQGGVEDVNGLGQSGEVEVVTGLAGRGGGVTARLAPVGVGLLSGGQRMSVVDTVPVGVAVTVGMTPASRGVVVEGGPVTRHSPTSPCTGRPRP